VRKKSFPKQYAFIDESGTNELDTSKKGVSQYFICVAIIVNEMDLDAIRSALETLRNGTFFQGNEIKSKTIGGTHYRRIEILKIINQLNFRFVAQVIDKDRIDEDSGLRYKRTFYKFINHMLYDHLSRSGFPLEIVADQIGSEDFMQSFMKYLDIKGNSFLTPVTHEFRNSNEEPLIQLADIIAGSLAYIFEASKKCEESKTFHSLLKPREIEIRCWPMVKQEATPPPTVTDEEKVNYILRIASLNRVQNYIEENQDNEAYQMEVATLRRLLFLKETETDSKKQWQYRDGLIKHLKNLQLGEIKPRQFTTRIIGNLRKTGILISSSQKHGYALVTTLEDFRAYIQHDQKIIIPMLRKLKIGRQAILQDVNVDILDGQDFTPIKKLVERISEHDLEEFIKSYDAE